MEPYKSHYDQLILPSRYKLGYIIWLMKLYAKKKPIDWAQTSTPEIINGTRPHMPKTKTNRRKKWFTLNFVPVTTQVQANARRKYGRSTRWNIPCTDWNKCSAKMKLRIWIKRTLDCSRSDLAKCTEEWIWTKYLNWTRIWRPRSVLPNSAT